jgi:hypothetical protein
MSLNDDEVTADTQPAATGKRTPDEWARTLGYVIVPSKRRGGRAGFTSEHRAAEILHGWIEHAHHAAAAIELTQADYEAAIDAAVNSSPARPHPGALSKHCNHQFSENEK